MSLGLVAAIVVVVLLGGYIWLLRRGRGEVAEAVREYATADLWNPFVSGYLAALDDIERTGVKPIREDARRHSAERAFRRCYIKREVPRS